MRFEARPPVLDRDNYFDTAAGSVSGAGSSIRIRNVGGAQELTTKTGGSSAPVLRDRTELTLELAPMSSHRSGRTAAATSSTISLPASASVSRCSRTSDFQVENATA